MLAELKQQAFLLIGVLLLFEALSNSLSISYAYGIGFSFYNKINLSNNTFQGMEGLSPYFNIGQFRPKFYTVDKGTLLGVIIGLFLAIESGPTFIQSLQRSKDFINLIFSKFFGKLIPLMVFGFLLNLEKSGFLTGLTHSYGLAFVIILLVFAGYISDLPNYCIAIFKSIYPLPCLVMALAANNSMTWVNINTPEVILPV